MHKLYSLRPVNFAIVRPEGGTNTPRQMTKIPLLLLWHTKPEFSSIIIAQDMALEKIVAGVTRVFTQRLAQHDQKTLETKKK